MMRGYVSISLHGRYKALLGHDPLHLFDRHQIGAIGDVQDVFDDVFIVDGHDTWKPYQGFFDSVESVGSHQL